jgi:PadR family transcriptional regulator, regulatory protein PadR
MKDITGNILRGHLETLVLALLEKGEAHGFEVLRRLKEESGGALNLKEGSLYPALYRLEEMGCIAGNWEKESEERARGPRRRIYALTPKGEKELADRREEWRSFTTILGRIVEGHP